jgi:hypothetical protein
MRYRLLNEPEPESVRHDTLAGGPDNQQALVTLGSALSDRLKGYAGDASREIPARLRDPYRRAYYSGILERGRRSFRKVVLAPASPTSSPPWLTTNARKLTSVRQAMTTLP